MYNLEQPRNARKIKIGQWFQFWVDNIKLLTNEIITLLFTLVFIELWSDSLECFDKELDSLSKSDSVILESLKILNWKDLTS